MKKSYLLDEIDCPHCAAKLEDAIRNVEGVKTASVNFFAQKLTVEIEENYDEIFKNVLKVIKKLEPDCEVNE
jgi:copper chaperone CopZ